MLEKFIHKVDLSAHRWTLDTQEDFALISAIFSALGSSGETFDTTAVLRFLATRPELSLINAHVEQKVLGV